MWKNYFGDKAKIYGIDIEPRCKELEGENIKIFIGSQSDRNFLRQVKSQIPPVDILLMMVAIG
jgi:4'-phosphopantetheinyl transferase EntD